MGAYGMLKCGAGDRMVTEGERWGGMAVQGQAMRCCVGCGCDLSRFNDTRLCGPCSRSPQLPAADELWSTELARLALSRWDVGTVVTLYRRYTGTKQIRIAAAVGIDQSEVSRLEGGRKQVRDRQQALVWTSALGVPDWLVPTVPAETGPGRETAQAVSLADLMLAVSDTDAALDAASRLWRGDASGELLVASEADLAAPVLAWLTSRPRKVRERSGSRRVGMSDVLYVRSALDGFVLLDDEHGGGRARDAAVRFLADEVTPLLEGSFTDLSGRALFAVACEFTLLVAWMAYDVGDAGRARAGFAHALALAQAADDRLLGASVLSAMSHLANHHDNPRQAQIFARAALDGVPATASPTLLAQFSAMSARAAARLGERGECERALAFAESALGQADPDRPAWIAYFDECEFTDEVAHCFRDLGVFRRSVDSAQACLSYPEQGSPRSRFFSRVVLAEALFGSGEPEQAAQVSQAALPLASVMASRRAFAYLAALRSRATSFSDVPVVAAFLEVCPA